MQGRYGKTVKIGLPKLIACRIGSRVREPTSHNLPDGLLCLSGKGGKPSQAIILPPFETPLRVPGLLQGSYNFLSSRSRSQRNSYPVIAPPQIGGHRSTVSGKINRKKIVDRLTLSTAIWGYVSGFPLFVVVKTRHIGSGGCPSYAKRCKTWRLSSLVQNGRIRRAMPSIQRKTSRHHQIPSVIQRAVLVRQPFMSGPAVFI